MVRVEVKARSFSMTVAMDCEDHELEYFIIDDTENTSHARVYLRKLYAAGNFEGTIWGPEFIEDELEITVKDLGICYVLTKEQTELVPENPTPQVQQHQHTGKDETTVTSIDGGNIHPAKEVTMVNLDDMPEENPTPTALKDHIRPCYQWSDNATKYLITAYKERKDLFFNKYVKKSAIWKEITQQLTMNGFGNPSTAQVEDKFKNLRRVYAKTKDSMGPNASGQPAPGKFKYYDEMDEIFTKNPQFDPPLVVSSQRKRDYIDDMENIQETKKIPKKKQSNTLETVLEAQNERHREILQEIRISRQTFADKLDKLIEKL